MPRFPRLYAAASLKRHVAPALVRVRLRFPRLYAAASLKLEVDRAVADLVAAVFRGFMPRPH